MSKNGTKSFPAFLRELFLYLDVSSAYLTSFCLPSILSSFLFSSSSYSCKPTQWKQNKKDYICFEIVLENNF
jgi:hypothetical protein